jgi:hypothetical protein
MKQFVAWPPPSWTECVVTWDTIFEKTYRPQSLYEWCDQYPSTGLYHVHGWESTEGFAFRFEDARDATVFKLTWTCR